MRRKVKVLLVVAIALICMIIPIAVSAMHLYNSYPEKFQLFSKSYYTSGLTYTGPNLGVNDRWYGSVVSSAYYTVKCQKAGFLGIYTQQGTTFRMPCESSPMTWCARWVNVNPERNSKFRFIYEAHNNTNPLSGGKFDISGFTIMLSEG